MYIEQILEMLEALDGAGLDIEDPEMIAEELEALGFCSEADPECEDESDEN